MILDALAPAKVNLFLHVGPLGADGYHPICSLMAFADVGDRLQAMPAQAFGLRVTGPFASQAPAGEDNLVLKAARRLFSKVAVASPPLQLTLTKEIPAGAGLGGGSSDAAAALKLLNRALGAPLGEEPLLDLAAELGSDVPACLLAAPVLAQGRGERLTRLTVPKLPAVLVWPAEACSTPAVYRAFDAAGPAAALEETHETPDLSGLLEAAAFLARQRNDLQGGAAALHPVISAAIDALEASGPRLARMSGSGSACFALFADDGAARFAARRLARAHPDWWVRACRIG